MDQSKKQEGKMNMRVDSNKHYSNFSSIPHKAGADILKGIQSLGEQGGAIVFGAAGEMGSKISITFPRANIKTIMQDVDSNKLEEVRKQALATMAKGVSKRKIPQSAWVETNRNNLFRQIVSFPDKNTIPFDDINKLCEGGSQDEARVFVSDFLDSVLGNNPKQREDYSNVMMVLEAGPEVLSFKQNVFRFFELALLSPNAVLATNTSSLSIDEVADKVENPERVIGFHYFLPADRNPLLEIIAGSKTSLEVVQGMHDLAIAMGKKPIICWKDSPGAIANRILCGVLNEAAKMRDKGIASYKEIDQIFLETFYSEQINVKLKKGREKFNEAPKLAMFEDEYRLYKEINACDVEQQKALRDGNYTLRKEILTKKKTLLEKAFGELRQKTLYAGVVENLARLGSFFTPAPSVSKLKELAKSQAKIIGDYLAHVEKVPDYITKPIELKSYEFPQSGKDLTKFPDYRNVIKNRLMGAYIAIGQKIFKEGLATAQDIELACKEGFKYNVGPLELARKLGSEKVKILTTIVNEGLDKSKPTGISGPGEYIELVNNELSGVQSYMQDGVGFIFLGRMHIQNLDMTQNSLSPEMLDGIRFAMESLKEKGAKAIFLRSQGGGAFSSGADLNYVRGKMEDDKKLLAYRNQGKQLMNFIANFEIPTIAIVDGAAVGGGFELALACDRRVFTDQGVSFLPEVGIGLVPDWGGIERLTAIVGKDFAKKYICSAKLKNMGIKLGGEDCYRVGIADAFITQANLQHLITDLIEGKGPINIYTKSPQKANHDKKANEFPAHIVARLGLNKPFKHNWRWVTKFPAHYAEDLINHADDAEYFSKANSEGAFLKLVQSAKKVQKRYVNPLLAAAQNKFWAKIFEKLGIL